MNEKGLIHGIAIREKKTKKLVDFIPCDVGNRALKVLSGVRINLGNNYDAQETFVKQEEIDLIEK